MGSPPLSSSCPASLGQAIPCFNLVYIFTSFFFALRDRIALLAINGLEVYADGHEIDSYDGKGLMGVGR